MPDSRITDLPEDIEPRDTTDWLEVVHDGKNYKVTRINSIRPFTYNYYSPDPPPNVWLGGNAYLDVGTRPPPSTFYVVTLIVGGAGLFVGDEIVVGMIGFDGGPDSNIGRVLVRLYDQLWVPGVGFPTYIPSQPSTYWKWVFSVRQSSLVLQWDGNMWHMVYSSVGPGEPMLY